MNSFSVFSVLSSSWKALKGCKGSIWLPSIICMIVLFFALNLLHVIGTHIYGEPLPAIWRDVIGAVVQNIVLGLFFSGIFMVAIKRLQGISVDANTGFQYFQRAPQAMTFMLIIGILHGTVAFFWELYNTSANAVSAGALERAGIMLIIQLLILALFFITIPLIADKNENALTAMWHSLKAMGRQLHKVILLIIILGITVVLAFLPTILLRWLFGHWGEFAGLAIFLVALIWFLPFTILVHSSTYLAVTRQRS